MRKCHFHCSRFLLLTTLLLVITATTAQVLADTTAASISERSIQKLEAELAETLEVESTTQRRRAYKNIVRSGLSLIKRRPDAANRFDILIVIFQCQKEQLVLQNSARNQQEIVLTCNKLLEAPDKHALPRLEAELLLSQWDLESNGATEHERLLSIAALADKYRGTPAEIDSLILAADIAFNLGSAELVKAFRLTLSTKFNDSSKATGFLRERFAYKSGSVLLRGHFKSTDGETLVLPNDRAGHVYLSCFWSHDTPGVKEKLLEIKALQKKYPSRFDVLSFNLDELPDAGNKTLQQWGLDWKPLHLPDGTNNKLFRSFTSNPDFLIRFTNASGYAIFTPIGSTYRTFGRVTDLEEYLVITMEHERFHALIQSIRIGDFLILDPNTPPSDTLKSIQACFTPAPMRYRVSKSEALANYTLAANLCDAAIKQSPSADDLWLVHNHRIIALLGMWNLGQETKHLSEAVKSANAVLAMNTPDDQKIVARFCLAKQSLRQEQADAKTIISDFINASGGEKVPALAVAAAAVLSLDAVSSSLYSKYRNNLLDDHADNPQLSAITAYCFDKFVNARLFRGNYYASECHKRFGFRDWQKDTETRPRKFAMKLKSLTGGDVNFPHTDPDQTNAVVFMEPPANAESAKIQIDLVGRLTTLANTHSRKKFNFVIAFVSEDIARINALVKKNHWDASRVAVVPGGLNNPHVLRLGIFLTDQRTNTMVVGHDGKITWAMGGMYYLANATNATADTVKEMSQRHDLRMGDLALKNGDYPQALHIFEGSFPPYARKFPYLTNAQFTGKSKAYRGLKNWQDAVSGYDAIIDAHTQHAARGYCVCHSLTTKLLMRAAILDTLGKKDEAEADRTLAKHLACPPTDPRTLDVGRHESTIQHKIETFKARKQAQAALDYINDIITNNKDGKQQQRNDYATVLREHAEILDHLGKPDQAKTERLHADALTKYPSSNTSPDQEQHPSQSYVDVVKKGNKD